MLLKGPALALPLGLLFASVLILVLGCSDQNTDPGSGAAQAPVRGRLQESPTQVARQFMNAVLRGDDQGLLDWVTDEARSGLANSDSLSIGGTGIESFDLVDSTVDGDECLVELSVVEHGKSETRRLLLRRDEGLWRVWGVRAALGDGEFTLDLETMSGPLEAVGAELANQMQKAFEEAAQELQRNWERGGSDEEIAAAHAQFAAITTVSPETHREAWEVTLESQGRTGGELIAELLDGTGLRIDSRDHAEALAKPLTLELSTTSRVEAVERIAREVELHPVWPDATSTVWLDDDSEGEDSEGLTLSFAEGLRTTDVGFSGPFLIEVRSLRENAPEATGTLELLVVALGLAPEVMGFQDEMREVVAIDRVEGPGATSLIEPGVSFLGSPERFDRYLSYTQNLDLRNLLRSTGSIASLRGEVRLPIPTAIEAVRLERNRGAATEVGGWSIRVENWAETVQLACEHGGLSVAELTAKLVASSASGAPLGTLWTNANGFGKTLSVSLQCPEIPQSVDLKLCVTEDLVYPFELRDLPLAHAAEQPERLAELEFTGNTPLSARLLDKISTEGEQWQIELELTNHSNKDIADAMVEFRYLDRSGRVLDDFPHSLMGDFDFEAERFGALVAAQSKRRLESSAAFVPAGTVRIAFAAKRMEFTDGTTWVPEGR